MKFSYFICLFWCYFYLILHENTTRKLHNNINLYEYKNTHMTNWLYLYLKLQYMNMKLHNVKYTKRDEMPILIKPSKSLLNFNIFPNIKERFFNFELMYRLVLIHNINTFKHAILIWINYLLPRLNNYLSQNVRFFSKIKSSANFEYEIGTRNRSK